SVVGTVILEFAVVVLSLTPLGLYTKAMSIFKRAKKGFTLPTVLITSIVLLGVLAIGISSTVAVRSALNDQHYTRIAELASEAGTAFAKACLDKSNNAVTWTDENPLKPNTDCEGNVLPDTSQYIQESQG